MGCDRKWSAYWRCNHVSIYTPRAGFDAQYVQKMHKIKVSNTYSRYAEKYRDFID